MKKRIGFMVCSLLSLSACSTQAKADHMMKCDYYNKDTEGEKIFTTLFTYVKETGEAVTGKINQRYNGFEKNEVNNKVLTEMAVRNSILDGFDGVKIEVLREDTSFQGQEVWNYRDVDIDSIMNADELQKEMIDGNERFYSKDLIEKHLEENGYACSVSEVR